MSALIEVRKLVKRFPGVNAVNGVSFDVEKGSCFGLLGPNGAGKTTTTHFEAQVLEGLHLSVVLRELFDLQQVSSGLKCGPTLANDQALWL